MSTEVTTSNKKELSERDLSFLDHYTNPESPFFGKVRASLELAGFTPTGQHHVLKRLSDEIVGRTKLYLATNSMKAAKLNMDLMDGTLQTDSELDVKKAKLRSDIAQDILDRAGISKKQEISMEVQTHAIVYLPQKEVVRKEDLPIDVEYEEVVQ